MMRMTTPPPPHRTPEQDMHNIFISCAGLWADEYLSTLHLWCYYHIIMRDIIRHPYHGTESTSSI